MPVPESEKKPGLFSRVMGAVVGSVIGLVVGAVTGVFRGALEFAKGAGNMLSGEFAPIGLVAGAVIGAAVGSIAGIYFGIRHAIEQGAKNGFAAGCKGGAVGGATWRSPDAAASAAVVSEVKHESNSASKAEVAPASGKKESVVQNQDRKEINVLINKFCTASSVYISALEDNDQTDEQRKMLKGKARDLLSQLDSKYRSADITPIEEKQIKEMIQKVEVAQNKYAERQSPPSAIPPISRRAQDPIIKEEIVESPRMRK